MNKKKKKKESKKVFLTVAEQKQILHQTTSSNIQKYNQDWHVETVTGQSGYCTKQPTVIHRIHSGLTLWDGDRAKLILHQTASSNTIMLLIKYFRIGQYGKTRRIQKNSANTKQPYWPSFSVLAEFFHIGRVCGQYDAGWFGHTDTILL